MIQLDLPMPSCCLRCHLKTVEEDIYGEYFYYCTPLKEAIYGDKYKKRRFRKCPLKEIKNENRTN